MQTSTHTHTPWYICIMAWHAFHHHSISTLIQLLLSYDNPVKSVMQDMTLKSDKHNNYDVHNILWCQILHQSARSALHISLATVKIQSYHTGNYLWKLYSCVKFLF